MRAILLAAALLSGCATSSGHLTVAGGSSRSAFVVQASSSSAGFASLGLLLGLLVIAFATDDLQGVGNPRADPELDPSRPVSEQDCSKPIDYSQGNIRCK